MKTRLPVTIQTHSSLNMLVSCVMHRKTHGLRTPCCCMNFLCGRHCALSFANARVPPSAQRNVQGVFGNLFSLVIHSLPVVRPLANPSTGTIKIKGDSNQKACLCKQECMLKNTRHSGNLINLTIYIYHSASQSRTLLTPLTLGTCTSAPPSQAHCTPAAMAGEVHGSEVLAHQHC